MIDKTYDAAGSERRIYALWEASGAFGQRRLGRDEADPYTIVIPPPNVTGSLHMGHALNNTLQDILVRFERMRGKDVLWQPGMDHAGIATQMVVERQLEGEGLSRHDLGRDAFVERVWKWKEESGGAIINQLKRMGASCDWSRERFTMDDGLSKAVVKVFVDLYRAGLIYKDKRLVNWDPVFQTAISDLEVVQRDVPGKMWRFAYPLVDGPVDGVSEIVIATTRPETMLGDGAVAVHPSDERYTNLIGKLVRLPVAERHIPIIADEYPDPEFGSGAVKITGAHDFNDFEVARRNSIPLIVLMDEQARMISTANNNVPAHYHGLDRFEARDLVLKEIEALGFYRGVEEKMIAQPFGDRSNVVIEPMLTDQWYVNAAELAKPAIAAVENSDTVFVPANWEKTYFEWMRNIQPWCISRQLWWGHRIPAWYGPDGEVFVAQSEDEARALARVHYGDERAIERDSDVLDTWFSSALWPFSTLGWPDETPELARHYKTDVLVTGFDIIFFWVARMIMAGLHFMKDENDQPEVPFHTVYIHALVRDETGQKMSKSKGNVMDPLELVDEYGADALRFTLAAMAAQGRDIKLAKSRVEGYRNFSTKLWNAARFCEMNDCVRDAAFEPDKVQGAVNRWMVGETEKTAKAVTAAIEAYRFNEAAGAIYRFTWNVFCDWYLEFSKPVLSAEGNGVYVSETRATAAWVLDRILLLLHPFAPFVTEELWALTGETGPKRDSLLIEARWPQLDDLVNADADRDVGWLVDAITAIRSARSEMRVPPSARLDLVLVNPPRSVETRLETHGDLLRRMARIRSVSSAVAAPDGSIQVLIGEISAALPLAGIIDVEAERARLLKDIGRLDGEITGIGKKLSNAQFLEKAPGHVVEEQRSRRADAETRRGKLARALESLS